MLPSLPRPLRLRPALALLLVAVGLTGLTACGQIDETGVGVRVLLTTDNGARTITDQRGEPVSDDESVLQVLQRVAKVQTDPQTGTVTAIDGKRATDGRAWTFWVNGWPLRSGTLPLKDDINLQLPETITAPQDAKVHNGDTVWFDLRPHARLATPRGVVGTFPEPFEHGEQGKRWPVRVECGRDKSQACRMVRDTLVRYGIPAVSNLVRSSYNPGSARIAVGTWTQLREDPSAQLAERGVAASGVYAVPQRDGRRIALLNDRGKTVQTLGAGSGLIFASRYRDEPPSWAVTGTDEAGVLEAAGALDETVLKAHLAVAVHGGTVTSLPVGKKTGKR